MLQQYFFWQNLLPYQWTVMLFQVLLCTDLKTLPIIFDSTPFLRLTGQFNNTLPCWHVMRTWAAVTAWPCVRRGGSGWYCASRSCLSRTVHPATPVINTQLSLPARACQNLWTRQQPLKGFFAAKPSSRASTQAPAKRPLLVVVTTQYSDLCWSTKLIWWSSPSQFNTREQKAGQGFPLRKKAHIWQQEMASKEVWTKTNPSGKVLSDYLMKWSWISGVSLKQLIHKAVHRNMAVDNCVDTCSKWQTSWMDEAYKSYKQSKQ